MRKIFIVVSLFLAATCSPAFGASKSELKLMSVFVSNFVEVGMNDFDADSLSNGQLAHFGIWHNKSRVKRCPDKDCP